MVSPILQKISMKKQALSKGRKQILLFLLGPRMAFYEFWKILKAKTMGQLEFLLYFYPFGH
jgi:hypothetical protein